MPGENAAQYRMHANTLPVIGSSGPHGTSGAALVKRAHDQRVENEQATHDGSEIVARAEGEPPVP